ncbi:probable G-protein coupled receptor Mth-like 11 [Drosophila eugracilis]|uniref:probable G-protein coupled receptor Mth-like 11 n=1 Tax=Drosophila eugracilis TaxID=29029 RepID=UPI001BDA3AEB|nr:probable G-protein coupled receptor Mth-like 11 [Drosophila eugracilis]
MELFKMNRNAYWCCVWSLLLIGIAADIPNCDYFDTVDLTHSLRFQNGSYKHEDLIIPASLTGEYDYKILYNGDKEEVPNHVRGCACKLKPCIRFCCHHKKLMKRTTCLKDINKNLTYNYDLNITLSNGTVTKKHVIKEMIVQQELPMPCNKHYHLDVERYKDDLWTLFENGTLLRHYDNAFLSKQDYCLQPRKTKNGKSYSIVPYNCIIEPSLTTAYIKIASIVFMALTIALYLWLPMFHTIHGMCCNLYFVCLMVTFMLNVTSMFGVFNAGLMCLINGYLGYYAVMATFLWLSVVSFNIWRRFGLYRILEFQKNSFLYYNLIVWSNAGILTLGVLLVDLLVPFASASGLNFVPGVGVTSCWIMTDRWSGMFYFYFPICILILFNISMFVLTTRHIYAENKLRPKVLTHYKEKVNSKDEANFGLYLYLFIIMGGCWIMEILSFICEVENLLKPLIKVNDIINCSQGIIIFLITVCNRAVLKGIRNRIFSKRSNDTCTATQDGHLMQQVK